jgi:predicted ATPase/tetratricopeptide (TPR) repeat protein/class 3 adenylate cyclase
MEFQDLVNKCSTHGHPPSQICLYCIPALTEAVELYHGEFMAGFNLSKAPAFDNWRMQQSEWLQNLYLNALENLVRGHRTFGDFNQAIHYARIWLVSDPFNEPAHLQLMQLYGITGQRTAAIVQYKHFKTILTRELGLDPSAEITKLYKQILGGTTTPRASEKLVTPIFLIADIEKPATFWAQAGAKKQEILTSYTNIVKEVSRRFGGHILQQAEDSITLLFENGQPLHCAVSIHMNLKKFVWGQTGPPNIRMVLYTTTVDEGSSSNFAMITHTASSLLSISWGGQIVFTEQTLRLLDLPAGSRIKDLGIHTLNDIEGPLHIYELLHPHLPSIEHPPIQSLARHLDNFPQLFPTFIGRETELSELTQLLESPDCRMISLVGPGGIGKTRLSIQFATQQAVHFSDGVFFISLAPIQDPDLIPIILADVLKFSYYGPKNYSEQLGGYLHRMNMLIVFDNFEHLRIGGDEFLAKLITQTHHLKILVTSRERLNLIGETIFEVPGLPVPHLGEDENPEDYSSIKLFLQNARRIFPGFKLDNNLAAIVRICQLVDGLPLGILLASSWVRALKCNEIALEIEKNIDFLTISAPDISPRHRSLRAVFDHSWLLLSEEDRRILSRLSIFRAAFTTNAAQAVCNASPLTLAVFVDKSLLRLRKDYRYEMMDTFHQYASGMLEASPEELTITSEKYFDYYTDFLVRKEVELNTSFQRQALDEFVAEFENIRSLWNWAVEHNRWNFIDKVKEPLLFYHVMICHYTEGRDLFRMAFLKLKQLNDPDRDLLRASMQQRDAWMAFRNGFTKESITRLAESLATFRAAGVLWDTAMALLFLAEANRTLGNFQVAKEYVDEGLQILNGDSLPKTNMVVAFTAQCQSVLGAILIELGKFDQAQTSLQSSLDSNNRIGAPYGSIQPLAGLGKLAYLQGEFVHARDLYLQALDTASELSDQRGMALLHNNLGAVYESMGDDAESYKHVLSALKLCKETGDRRLMAIVLNNLAYHKIRFLQNPPEAIRSYHESLEIFSEIGDLRGITYTFYDLSFAYLMVGLMDEARHCCSQSLHTAMTLDSTPLILHTLHGYANLFDKLQERERALRLCYLISAHPKTEPDTHKRVTALIAEIEPNLSTDRAEAASLWGQSTNLQDVIDQILTGNIPLINN